MAGHLGVDDRGMLDVAAGAVVPASRRHCGDQDYLAGQDVLQAFLDECCAVGAKYDDTIDHIWRGWKDWASESGEYVGTKRKLGERLEDKGFRRSRATGGRRKYMGICCMR
jgi:hypothetical protein